jgi:DNA repair exonuclease SbcCD ATPase subunit
MNLKFTSVKFKNLLSYGNTVTEVTLDTHRNTIITASNGHGKSTVIESICYALYGKPYRKIKLGQLVNSINRKALWVEINFTAGSHQYKVIRGQKPNIFEIWEDGELIKEDSASRDYQNYLETEILGLNFKTFKQIVVIGSASYVPFMNLDASDRRNITEEVLDIAVFSSMLDIAKQKVSEHKSAIDSLSFEIASTKSQIESQKAILSVMEAEQQSKSEELIQRQSALHESIQEQESVKTQCDAEIEVLGDVEYKLEALRKNTHKIEVALARLDGKIQDCEQSIAFFGKHTCPSCQQTITDDIRMNRQQALENTIGEHTHSKEELSGLLKSATEKIDVLVSKVTELNAINNKRHQAMFTIQSLRKQLAELEAEVPAESIALSKQQLKELVKTLVGKTEEKNSLSKSIEYYKTSVEVLKDSGIKAKIIATFIPLMNKLINEYLEKFDMFVSFELDETFTETIKSRNRDTFSYNSFSEGEKRKIDLSILFAWRKIAMSRNSVATNLLIFDETLDSSLDESSVNTFVDILDSIESDVNTIVISHRNMVPELFDRHIKVEKVRDFSILTET